MQKRDERQHICQADQDLEEEVVGLLHEVVHNMLHKISAPMHAGTTCLAVLNTFCCFLRQILQKCRRTFTKHWDFIACSQGPSLGWGCWISYGEDTGAAASILCYAAYKWYFKYLTLRPVERSFHAYAGTSLDIAGQILVDVEHHGQREILPATTGHLHGLIHPSFTWEILDVKNPPKLEKPFFTSNRSIQGWSR